ncbi:MAG: helix-turn-helix transcriptional regulator [Dongiaceae bacterium]
MALTNSIDPHIAKKLRDKGYRHRFFARMAQDEVASRIRELRGRRHLRQADLAQLAGMKQSAVSRIEQSDYAGWTFNTLLRVARALDVRLRLLFEPMEDMIRLYEQWEAEGQARTGWEEPLPMARSAFSASADVGLDSQLRGAAFASGIRKEVLRQHFIPVRSMPAPFDQQQRRAR